MALTDWRLTQLVVAKCVVSTIVTELIANRMIKRILLGASGRPAVGLGST